MRQVISRACKALQAPPALGMRCQRHEPSPAIAARPKATSAIPSADRMAGRGKSLRRSPIGGSTGRRATCRPRLSQPATGYVIFHLDPPCTPMNGSSESGRKPCCDRNRIIPVFHGQRMQPEGSQQTGKHRYVVSGSSVRQRTDCPAARPREPAAPTRRLSRVAGADVER